MTEAEKKYGWEEGGKIVRITREAYDSILSQAREDAPIESCGYVLGLLLRVSFNTLNEIPT